MKLAFQVYKPTQQLAGIYTFDIIANEENEKYFMKFNKKILKNVSDFIKSTVFYKFINLYNYSLFNNTAHQNYNYISYSAKKLPYLTHFELNFLEFRSGPNLMFFKINFKQKFDVNAINVPQLIQTGKLKNFSIDILHNILIPFNVFYDYSYLLLLLWYKNKNFNKLPRDIIKIIYCLV